MSLKNSKLTRVVDSGFDAVAESDPEFGLFVLELLVELGLLLEDVGQKIGVLREVGQFLGHFTSQESRILLLAEVLLKIFLNYDTKLYFRFRPNNMP